MLISSIYSLSRKALMVLPVVEVVFGLLGLWADFIYLITIAQKGHSAKPRPMLNSELKALCGLIRRTQK